MKNIIVAITAVIIALAAFLFWQSNYTQHDMAKHTEPQSISSTNNGSTTTVVSSKNNKNLVEIFYLNHAPAQAILKKVEAILEKHPEYTVINYDFDDEKNKQKVDEYGLLEHSPIAIFIAGVGSFKVGDSIVKLANFPKGNAFVPSLEGSWDYSDLEKILANPDKYKNDN